MVSPVNGRLLETRLARGGLLQRAGHNNGRLCVVSTRGSPGIVGRVKHLHRVTFHTNNNNANLKISVSRCSAVRIPCGRLIM